MSERWVVDFDLCGLEFSAYKTPVDNDNDDNDDNDKLGEAKAAADL
jgi:hypothetical protein